MNLIMLLGTRILKRTKKVAPISGGEGRGEIKKTNTKERRRKPGHELAMGFNHQDVVN